SGLKQVLDARDARIRFGRGDGRDRDRRITLVLGAVTNGDLVVGGRDFAAPCSGRPAAGNQGDGKSTADGVLHRSSPSRQGRGGSTLFQEVEFLRVPFGNEFLCCVGATIEDTTGMEKLHPAQRGRVRVGPSVGAGQLRPDRSVPWVLCQSRVGI